ncbi:uncharacterized protein LOC113305767 [Papaver somniferum]|uniref:uncharacterized protein LOC113305767 n=1 Tax=Papaver somniferum TaxID=3469 RepID=UPI000E6FE8A2|nr:uncharacterized protein LOC113305767 [Papaver somniferum]
MHLEANKLGHTINGGDCASDERAKAVAYLHRHLFPAMKHENNELLIKNHESRPCGSALVPEVNKASYSGHGHDRGQKRKRGGYRHRNAHNHLYNKNTEAKQDKGKGSISNPQKKSDNPPKNGQGCYRCGCTDHWYRSCRADLCEPHKKKEVNVEMNLAERNIFIESPKLEVSDYLLDFEGNEYQFPFDQFADDFFSVD